MSAYNVYLPIVTKEKVLELGTHVVSPNADRMQYAVEGQTVGWVIELHKIEKKDEEGNIYLDWSLYDRQYEHIKDYRRWLQVKYVPEWMRVIPEKRCSPPLPWYWNHFAQMVVKVLDRYKPFAVEIWNEPEVPPEETDEFWSGVFGCWSAGKDFGNFLTNIYPVIKEAHPNTTVMGGALMLESEEHYLFAEQMCEYGTFDVLSFHSYSGFGLKNYYVPLTKADRLAQMTSKPLWLSETAYRSRVQYDTLEQEKREYLEFLYSNAAQSGIKKIMWYTLANNEWENTDLVLMGVKKPAWYLFKELIINN